MKGATPVPGPMSSKGVAMDPGRRKVVVGLRNMRTCAEGAATANKDGDAEAEVEAEVEEAFAGEEKVEGVAEGGNLELCKQSQGSKSCSKNEVASPYRQIFGAASLVFALKTVRPHWYL